MWRWAVGVPDATMRPSKWVGCRGAPSEAPCRKRDCVVVEGLSREHARPRGTQFPGPVWTSLAGVAHLLGVKRRKVGELRRDPAFPSGRLFGGGGTLRFKVADVLAWLIGNRRPSSRPLAPQPASSNGGSRPSHWVREVSAGRNGLSLASPAPRQQVWRPGTFPLARGSLGCVYCAYGGLRSILGCPGERGGLYQFR